MRVLESLKFKDIEDTIVYDSIFNNEDFNANARVFNGCEFSNIDFSDKDVMNVASF